MSAPALLSPEVVVCFQKAVELLHASLPPRPTEATPGAQVAAQVPAAQILQLIELCADLLLVAPVEESLEPQSGGTQPRIELRFATLLENRRFLSLLHRVLTTNPTSFTHDSSSVGSFTSATFTALQCRVLRLFVEVAHVIGVFPYLVSLVHQQLLDDRWLELLLRYAALYRHHHEMEAVVLESVLLVTRMHEQALGDLPLIQSSNDARPQSGFFVTQSEFIFLLRRVKDTFADDIVRNLALGIIKMWLCHRTRSSETVSASLLFASQFRGPGNTLESLQRSRQSSTFVLFDDVFLARDAVGDLVVWLFASYLDGQGPRGTVLVGSQPSRKEPRASHHHAVWEDENVTVARPSFSQNLFSLCTASDILVEFLLGDGLDPLPPSLLHGSDVLYQGLNNFIVSNWLSSTATASTTTAISGGGSLASSEAALDILVQDSDVIKSVKDINACAWALFAAVRDSAAYREASRYRLAIQTMVSVGRWDEVMNAMASWPPLVSPQNNAQPRGGKPMIECIADFISASAAAAGESKEIERGRSPSPAAQLALSTAIVCVAAAKASTRQPQLRDMCQHTAPLVLPLVHHALLVDGYKGDIHVVLSGPNGEHLNNVDFVSNSPEFRDSFASVHAMARATSYILDPHRTDALKPTKAWAPASQDGGEDGPLQSRFAGNDDNRVSVIEKQHKLTFALIASAVLGAL